MIGKGLMQCLNVTGIEVHTFFKLVKESYQITINHRNIDKQNSGGISLKIY